MTTVSLTEEETRIIDIWLSAKLATKKEITIQEALDRLGTPLRKFENTYDVVDGELVYTGLCTRTVNSLEAQGITHINQLAEYSDRELLRFPNIGKKCLMEIKGVLEGKEDE